MRSHKHIDDEGGNGSHKGEYLKEKDRRSKTEAHMMFTFGGSDRNEWLELISTKSVSRISNYREVNDYFTLLKH